MRGASPRRAVLGGLLLLLLAPALPASAQKSSDTLRVAWRDALPDLDPYYNAERTGLVLSHEVWDTLVERDPDTLQIRPLLALSWRSVDDTTIEFALRPGVHFHDGSPFGADDVVYTIGTVLADPHVAAPSNYGFLAGAERIDDLHVRVKLRRPTPAALEQLAMILPIWPSAYRQRLGPDGYARAPVGTGPYRIAEVDGTTGIDLERNDGYFDGPKGHPAIRRVEIRTVPNPVAALLDGQADWTWMFDPDRLDAVARDPGLVGLRAESMRIGFLSLDAAGRSGPSPLTDLRVRQAIFHAIDRAGLARRLVGGRVLDAPCYPTQFGCDQAAGVRYAYDPVAARQLLAQAGFPDGFSTDLVTAALPQYAAALQHDLQAIGIAARLVELPLAEVGQRAVAGRAPLLAGSWGSYSINDVSAILPVFFGGGAQDYSRDPELERLVQQGGSESDPDARRAAYSAAIQRITAQAYWLPLCTEVTTYAFTRTLNFRPHPDELPRFYATSWK